jgi:N-acetylglucosamine kinase-like BadF-type ATPase
MQLSRILHICANRGDAVARRILEDCGIDYVNAIRGMVKELPLLSEKPVEIILVGSNFTKCESTHAIDTIDSMLNNDKGNRQYILKPISSKPVSGAVIWAHESAGIEIDAEARNKCKMLLNQSII